MSSESFPSAATVNTSPCGERRGWGTSAAADENAATAVREGKATAEKRSREGGEMWGLRAATVDGVG